MKAGHCFVLPALTGLGLFVICPFLLALAFAFTNLRLGSPFAVEFVGGQQFARLAQDPTVHQAVRNNVCFSVLVVPLQTAAALALAILLQGRGAGLALLRAVFFLPVVLPMSLVAVIWGMLYAPHGPLNALLLRCSGGLWQPLDFLHDPRSALAALIVLSIWQGLGMQMVILLAGLQGIPPVLYEAALLDGAGPWNRFRHITLPQLRNPLMFTAVATAILSFRVFDQVQILTQGGPVGSTATIVFLMVTTVFERLQIGQASALTVLFFGLVLLAAWGQSRLR